MKEYLKFLISSIIAAFVLFEVITLGILMYPRGRFYQSYQSLIQDKYRILIETNTPKIIMIAGSSSAFGLNQSMLEEATGYKVANLGLHAGFGHWFYTIVAQLSRQKSEFFIMN